MNVAQKIRAFLGSAEHKRRTKRDRRIALYRAGQDSLQADCDARADAMQVELDGLLEIETPSPEEEEQIAMLTSSIAALRASASRIRSELAGGLPV